MNRIGCFVPLMLLLIGCNQTTDSDEGACPDGQIVFGGNCRYSHIFTRAFLLQMEFSEPRLTIEHYCDGTPCTATSVGLDEIDTSKSFGLYYRPEGVVNAYEGWYRSGLVVRPYNIPYYREYGFQLGDSSWDIRWRKNQLGVWYVDSGNSWSGSYYRTETSGDTLILYWH
jgi:hypothetical protein